MHNIQASIGPGEEYKDHVHISAPGKVIAMIATDVGTIELAVHQSANGDCYVTIYVSPKRITVADQMRDGDRIVHKVFSGYLESFCKSTAKGLVEQLAQQQLEEAYANDKA